MILATVPTIAIPMSHRRLVRIARSVSLRHEDTQRAPRGREASGYQWLRAGEWRRRPVPGTGRIATRRFTSYNDWYHDVLLPHPGRPNRHRREPGGRAGLPAKP